MVKPRTENPKGPRRDQAQKLHRAGRGQATARSSPEGPPAAACVQPGWGEGREGSGARGSLQEALPSPPTQLSVCLPIRTVS